MASHQKFTEQYGISFPLIADDGSLKKLYSQRRTAYIIDQQGVIQYIYQGVPDNQKLLDELERLQQGG